MFQVLVDVVQVNGMFILVGVLFVYGNFFLGGLIFIFVYGLGIGIVSIIGDLVMKLIWVNGWGEIVVSDIVML